MRIFLGILLLFLASCKFNATSTNHEKDLRDAELITRSVYESLRINDSKETYPLFDSIFYEATDTPQLALLYTKIDSLFGKVIGIELDKWETKIVIGTHSRSEYALKYIVTRSKSSTIETLLLRKREQGIKIVSYKIDMKL